MTHNPLTLFCLVDGEDAIPGNDKKKLEATTQLFKSFDTEQPEDTIHVLVSIFLHIPVNLSPDDSIGDLKKLVKTEKAPEFDDIVADKLTLWRVSIPITDSDELPILLDNVADKDKKKLRPVTRLSKVFPGDIPEEAINIIVQRPPTATSVELFPTVAVFKVTPVLYLESDEELCVHLSTMLRDGVQHIPVRLEGRPRPLSQFDSAETDRICGIESHEYVGGAGSTLLTSPDYIQAVSDLVVTLKSTGIVSDGSTWSFLECSMDRLNESGFNDPTFVFNKFPVFQ
ncbi:hypothetical protein BG003_007011 [Podila horticola]|nr:hypothetical protein BG003_007011 [Podila horticola]